MSENFFVVLNINIRTPKKLFAFLYQENLANQGMGGIKVEFGTSSVILVANIIILAEALKGDHFSKKSAIVRRLFECCLTGEIQWSTI